MRPILVIAHLVNGYVSTDPYGPTLDGLLAAALMRERLGDEYELSAMRPSAMTAVEGLPLLRVEHEGLWWYACSAPTAEVALRERKHFHRRFDDHAAVDLLPAVKRVADTAGPYKAYRLSRIRTVTPALTWHAVGDADEVRRLLNRVPAIGGARGSGHGEVAEWIVEPGGDEQVARTRRPLPVAFARLLGLDGPVMLAGIRPPARLPCNTVECVVPRAT